MFFKYCYDKLTRPCLFHFSVSYVISSGFEKNKAKKKERKILPDLSFHIIIFTLRRLCPTCRSVGLQLPGLMSKQTNVPISTPLVLK